MEFSGFSRNQLAFRCLEIVEFRRAGLSCAGRTRGFRVFVLGLGLQDSKVSDVRFRVLGGSGSRPARQETSSIETNFCLTVSEILQLSHPDFGYDASCSSLLALGGAEGFGRSDLRLGHVEFTLFCL